MSYSLRNPRYGEIYGMTFKEIKLRSNKGGTISIKDQVLFLKLKRLRPLPGRSTLGWQKVGWENDDKEEDDVKFD